MIVGYHIFCLSSTNDIHIPNFYIYVSQDKKLEQLLTRVMLSKLRYNQHKPSKAVYGVNAKCYNVEYIKGHPDDNIPFKKIVISFKT